MQSPSIPTKQEQYLPSEPDEDWGSRGVDPVRAEIAGRGGERLVEFITDWLGELVGDLRRPLFSSYGWVARVKRQARDRDLWWQPADGGRALWLVAPGPAWSMSELLDEIDIAHHSLEHRVILIEPLSPLEPLADAGYDGVLYGACSSPVSDGIGTALVSRAEYGLMGQEIWAAVVDLPSFV